MSWHRRGKVQRREIEERRDCGAMQMTQVFIRVGTRRTRTGCKHVRELVLVDEDIVVCRLVHSKQPRGVRWIIIQLDWADAPPSRIYNRVDGTVITIGVDLGS